MTSSPTPEHGFIDADGLRLHYLDWGNSEAQPMLLLHGLQDCANSWDFFAAAMCSDYHVIALDHRGHGDSGQASEDRYRLIDYVSDVHDVVEFLGLRDLLLVGHSAGGRNAFMYAVANPNKVTPLAVVDIDRDECNPETQGMFRR